MNSPVDVIDQLRRANPVPPSAVEDSIYASAAELRASLRATHTFVPVTSDDRPPPPEPSRWWRFAAAAAVIAVGGVAVTAAIIDTADPVATVSTLTDNVSCDPVADEPECSTAAGPVLEEPYGAIEAGTHTFDVKFRSHDLLLTATVPDGWAAGGGQGGGFVRFVVGGAVDVGGEVELDAGERNWAVITVWSTPERVVRGHPCEYREVEIVPTVESMADALASQPLRDVSAPRQITVGQHDGVELDLTVPAEPDRPTCEEYAGAHEFPSWWSAHALASYDLNPASHDLIRLVDVDGTLIVVQAQFLTDLSADKHTEMVGILDSMTLELRRDLRWGVEQLKPAIEAVRAEVGADVAICRVSTVGPMITVTALDGSTLRTFRYESRVLTESDQTSRYRDTCAAADDVLALDVGMFHVFLIDHPATDEFVISGMDGEPSYHAWVPSSNGEHRVRFNLDSQTGETVSTFP